MGARLMVVATILTPACRIDFDPLTTDAPADVINCTAGTRQIVAMGHCYALHETGANILWNDAKAACVAEAGHLVTYASADEETAVINVFAPVDRTWIGMTDSAMEGTWVWITGEPFSYMNWRAIEPNNGGGGAPENCGVNSAAATIWQWNDIACDGGTNGTPNFICEIE